MKRLLVFALFAFAGVAYAADTCVDAASEPHHRVIYSSNTVRVLELQLSRLESTKPFCYARPFLRIAMSDTRASSGITGQGMTSRDWKMGEARFVYVASERTIRNDTNMVHREIIVETYRTTDYAAHLGGYDSDEFPSDPGSPQTTWSVSLTRGSLSAQKTQLAAKGALNVPSPDHLLIALDDLQLSMAAGGKSKEIRLKQGDSMALVGGGEFTLSNSANTSSKFILVEL
jgi:hypothetical protein